MSFLSDAFAEFVVDLVFEIGVALIGAAIVAYVLGIILNQQQNEAEKWRKEVREKIEKMNQGD